MGKYLLSRSFFKDKKPIMIILAVNVLVIVVMLPLKPVIAGDDFSIILSVKHLLNTGELFIYSHPTASIIFQVLWGSFFAKLFGFSIPMLHFSVYLFLPFLSIFFYFLCRELKIGQFNSLILALFLISIPWYFRYAFGFRTDLPYTALQMASVYFYVKGFKRGKIADFVIGSVFTSLAFLTRQLGFMIALSALLPILMWKIHGNIKYKFIIASLLIPILTVVFYNLWLSYTDNITINEIWVQRKFVRAIEELLPFTSISIPDRLESYKESFHRGLDYFSQMVGFSLSLMILIILSNVRFFLKFAKNNYKLYFLILSLFGLLYLLDMFLYRGKVTLGFPIIIYESEKLFPIPWANIWKLIVATGLVLTPLYFSIAIKTIRISKKEFLFIFLLFLGLFLLTISAIFAHDQYVMPILPIFVLFLGLITKEFKINKAFAFFVLAFLLLDSLQISKQVYVENAIAQQKASELVNTGVRPQDILPGKNHAWHFWYDFESLEKKEIEKAGGNRKVAAVPDLITDNYKYIIMPERDLQYSNTQLKNPVIERIPFSSFLVKSELLFIKNNSN